MKAIFKFYEIEKILDIPDYLVIIHDLANELADRVDVTSDPEPSVFDQGWAFLRSTAINIYCDKELIDRKSIYVRFHKVSKEELSKDIKMSVYVYDLAKEIERKSNSKYVKIYRGYMIFKKPDGNYYCNTKYDDVHCKSVKAACEHIDDSLK